MNQKAVKVIVGDTHQQVYGWRFAINSLEKTDFKNYPLSTSFRFNQSIADLAKEALRLKKHIGRDGEITIIGKGESQTLKSRAVLGRSNLGLLLKAIDLLSKNQIKRVYFEGNINSYTYADEGASLYDVLNLYNAKHHLIKDKLIRDMKDIAELEDYIEKTEDNQLGMMVEIVKEYGNEIPGIIRSIKEKHVKDEERKSAEIIFSTVHRCKGLEYDDVYLVNDLITEEKLRQILTEKKEEGVNKEKLNEEINLLYVALTRTKNRIHIRESLVPVDFPPSANIHILKENSTHENTGSASINEKQSGSPAPQKSYSPEKVRENYADAYKPWTSEQDDELTIMYCEQVPIPAMASHFGRTMGAIRARIKKLELDDLYG